MAFMDYSCVISEGNQPTLEPQQERRGKLYSHILFLMRIKGNLKSGY